MPSARAASAAVWGSGSARAAVSVGSESPGSARQHVDRRRPDAGSASATYGIAAVPGHRRRRIATARAAAPPAAPGPRRRGSPRRAPSLPPSRSRKPTAHAARRGHGSVGVAARSGVSALARAGSPRIAARERRARSHVGGRIREQALAARPTPARRRSGRATSAARARTAASLAEAARLERRRLERAPVLQRQQRRLRVGKRRERARRRRRRGRGRRRRGGLRGRRRRRRDAVRGWDAAAQPVPTERRSEDAHGRAAASPNLKLG